MQNQSGETTRKIKKTKKTLVKKKTNSVASHTHNSSTTKTQNKNNIGFQYNCNTMCHQEKPAYHRQQRGDNKILKKLFLFSNKPAEVLTAAAAVDACRTLEDRVAWRLTQMTERRIIVVLFSRFVFAAAANRSIPHFRNSFDSTLFLSFICYCFITNKLFFNTP
jgi:hypothetical protein